MVNRHWTSNSSGSKQWIRIGSCTRYSTGATWRTETGAVCKQQALEPYMEPDQGQALEWPRKRSNVTSSPRTAPPLVFLLMTAESRAPPPDDHSSSAEDYENLTGSGLDAPPPDDGSSSAEDYESITVSPKHERLITL
ncbi:hypothetical protein SRHO_G00178930 [Serrasalmus rhombeus]